MKTYASNESARRGVALIIVLGLLAIMTLLTISFSIAMRIERLAARNYANSVRARNLIHAGAIRAMDEVVETMRAPAANSFNSYPDFSSKQGAPDAMVSTTGPSPRNPTYCRNIFTGEIRKSIPSSLWKDIESVTNRCEWIRLSQGTNVVGRYAYLVVNTSGLIDGNYAGGDARWWSTNVSELDLSLLPEFGSSNAVQKFVQERKKYRRFESAAEISSMINGGGTGRTAPSLFCYSFDPDRDVYATAYNQAKYANGKRGGYTDVGKRNIALTSKFFINDITNFACYKQQGNPRAYMNDKKFMDEYWTPLYTLLKKANLKTRPSDMAWNIVNYLDPDRLPQSGVKIDEGTGVKEDTEFPWRHTEGGEGTPLINEIVFLPPNQGGNPYSGYTFATELWFPFAGYDSKGQAITVDPNDPNASFYIWVAAYNKQVKTENEWFIMDDTNPKLSDCMVLHTQKIERMEFGQSNEFRVVYGPEIPASWNADPTNIYYLARVMMYLTNYVITATNTDGRIKHTRWFPVDESMGYRLPTPGDPETVHKRLLKNFSMTDPRGYSVNDPRSNGQVKYWWSKGNRKSGIWTPIGGLDYPYNQHTLGQKNKNCDPWKPNMGQGLPIFAKNGPMVNAAEIGHMFLSNLDDELPNLTPSEWWWRTIDLMNPIEGAYLLDLISVRQSTTRSMQSRASTRGGININTHQAETLQALLYNLEIGFITKNLPQRYNITKNKPQEVQSLIKEIMYNGPYDCYRSLFTGTQGDPLATAFAACAPVSPLSPAGVNGKCDIMVEDTFRHICDLITFRQNMFMVVVAAQTLASDKTTVTAESRAVSLVYRDAFTGRYFDRQFRWLQ